MIDITDYILINPAEYDEHFTPEAELNSGVREAMFRGLFHPAIGLDSKSVIRFIKMFRKRKINGTWAAEYANFFMLYEEDFEEEAGRIQECLDKIEHETDIRIERQQEIESEISDIEKDIEEVESKINELDPDYEYYEDDKKSFEKEIGELNNEIERLDNEVDEINTELAELEDDKAEAEAVEKELSHYDMRV